MSRYLLYLVGCLPFVSIALSKPSLTLSTQLSELHSFHAHFHEVSGDRTAEGELWIQKPGKFYWKTISPAPESFLSDGRYLYHDEPDLLQVTKTPLSGGLAATPLLLLSGKVKDLSVEYTVQSTGPESYQLTPKDSDHSGELVESMTLVFKENELAEFSLKSTLGQETVVTFSSVEWNPMIPDARFDFHLPAGSDLFEG
jgi:outer membrane lipoprotein carrier protein